MNYSSEEEDVDINDEDIESSSAPKRTSFSLATSTTTTTSDNNSTNTNSDSESADKNDLTATLLKQSNIVDVAKNTALLKELRRNSKDALLCIDLNQMATKRKLLQEGKEEINNRMRELYNEREKLNEEEESLRHEQLRIELLLEEILAEEEEIERRRNYLDKGRMLLQADQIFIENQTIKLRNKLKAHEQNKRLSS